MTKEKVITIGNALLQNQGDFSLWVELISDFVSEKAPDKLTPIIQAFPQLPQPIQIRMVQIALEYFGKKFTICSVSMPDKNSSMIINGVPQTQMKILCYF